MIGEILQLLEAILEVSEYQIIKIVENVCNLKKHEADWILKIDIVEKGDELEVLGYSDTDVVEYLYKKKPKLDALIKFTCKDLTGASSSKPQPVPKDLDLHRLFVEVTSRGRIAKVLKWIRKDKYWQNTLGFSVEPY